MTKNARIHNGEKTVSSRSDAEKTGSRQSHVKQWDYNVPSQHIKNKIKSKWFKDLKTPRREHRLNTLWNKS